MAIEGAKDVRSMKLEELIGSLRTFEMNFEEEHVDKKNKGIVLKDDTKIDDMESRYDDDKDLVESFEMLSNNMCHVIKKMNRRSSSSVPQHGPGNL